MIWKNEENSNTNNNNKINEDNLIIKVFYFLKNK